MFPAGAGVPRRQAVAREDVPTIPQPTATETGAAHDTPRAEFRLAAGRIVLIEGTDPGVSGIVLGVASLAAAAKGVALRDEAPVAWLDAVVTHGARIGFAERRTG